MYIHCTCTMSSHRNFEIITIESHVDNITDTDALYLSPWLLIDSTIIYRAGKWIL